MKISGIVLTLLLFTSTALASPSQIRYVERLKIQLQTCIMKTSANLEHVRNGGTFGDIEMGTVCRTDSVQMKEFLLSIEAPDAKLRARTMLAQWMTAMSSVSTSVQQSEQAKFETLANDLLLDL